MNVILTITDAEAGKLSIVYIGLPPTVVQLLAFPVLVLVLSARLKRSPAGI